MQALKRVQPSVDELKKTAEDAVRLAFGPSLLPTGEQLCPWGRIHRGYDMMAADRSELRAWTIKKKIKALEEETLRLSDLAQRAVDELADAGVDLDVKPCKCDYCRKGWGNV